MDTLPADRFSNGTEGLFNIPAATYHAAHGVSRSVLVKLMEYTPAHAKVKTKVTRAMDIGTLADHAVLEPDLFVEGTSYWLRPEGLNLNSKLGRGWKAEHPGPKDGGLPYLELDNDSSTDASLTDIRNMREAVMRHPIARAIIEISVKQESAFCLCPHTGLMRRCRPDCRAIDARGRVTLADLKSTGVGGLEDGAWSVQCARMFYHVQDVFYSDIYHDLVGERPFFVFIVVERKPPYEVRLFQVDQAGKNRGRERVTAAMERYKNCTDTGDWWGYPKVINVIQLPRFEMNPSQPIIQ